MIEYLQNLASTHTLAVQIIGFGIALIESLAIIGTIIPGSLTMLPFGLMLGSGILPFWSTFYFIILGAFIGDLISYYIGVYYKNNIAEWSFFKKNPSWLESSQKFINHHGGKSIIIGRFFGPLRSSIPLIAGALDMKTTPFILAAIPSVILWALVYLAPGFTVSKWGAQLTTSHWVFITSIVILACILYAYKASQKVILFLLTSRYIQAPAHLVGSCWIALIISCVYLILSSSVTLGLVQPINAYFDPLLAFVRTPAWVDLGIAFSISADKKTLFVMSVLGALTLLVTKKYRSLILLIIPILLQVLIVQSSKIIIACPRPVALFESYSFPSGHISASIVLSYAVYTICLAGQSQRRRRFGSVILSIWCVFVGLSQLSLRAHWILDFVGAMLASILVITIFRMILTTMTDKIEKLSDKILIWLIFVAIVSQSMMIFTYSDKGRYHILRSQICQKK